MIITFKKSFAKQYYKLSKKQRSLVDSCLVKFELNPFSPELKNHPLKGNLKGKRSISAAFDLRLIYSEKENHTIIEFIGVGTHNQVY